MNPLGTMTDATRDRLVAAGLDPDRVDALVRLALDEDLMGGVDVTSEATIAPEHESTAVFRARVPGVVAGLPVAAAVVEIVCGSQCRFTYLVADGAAIGAGSELARVTALTSPLLTAERTALNLLCRLSGVATLTRRWADQLVGTVAEVRDTRKTTPGLRQLEKYAVRCGGGVNHRQGLYDMALVKDNHVEAAGGVAEATELVRSLRAEIPVEIEVDDLDGLDEAIAAGADEVLLDNFDVEHLKLAVARRDAAAPHVRLEASGGLTIGVARSVAETGVDWIAVGELTHSAPILDIGLDLVADGAAPDEPATP